MITDSNKLLGQSLGTCTLQRLLGRGGMGAVYLAQQSRPRRTVAVKVLMPGVVLDAQSRAEFLARFRREADAIAALDHVNIMPIYEYGEQEDIAYLVMPYITGGTLRERIERRGILPLSDTLPIIEQAAAALDCAHEYGIVHRDLKPGNILFHADGRALLADFGLAKVLKDVTESTRIGPSGALTSVGTIVGTPEYLSPEQGTGNPVDYRTDVYSLGIVLFQMLCGQVPFTGTSPVAIAVKHAVEEPPLVSELNPNITPGIDAVVKKALAKKPEMRFSSAGELARALRVAITGVDTAPAPSIQLMVTASHDTPPLESYQTVPNVEMHQAVTEEAPRIESATSGEQTQVGIGATPTMIEEPATITTPRGQYEVPKTPVLLQQPVVPASRRTKLPLRLILLVGLLALVIVGGSVGVFSLTHEQSTQTQQVVKLHATPSPHTGTTPTASSRAFTPPAPRISAGKLLYATDTPGTTCDSQKGQWSNKGTISAKCTSQGTELVSTDTSHLAGLYLNAIPNGTSIPTNYVIQVQVEQKSGSSGDVGVLFRNQSGQGAYLFVITATGKWAAYAYNASSGQQALVTSGSIFVPFTSSTTIDIQVNQNVFSLYVNGVRQGGIQDGNYTSGTLAFVAANGADVVFKNVALYALQ